MESLLSSVKDLLCRLSNNACACLVFVCLPGGFVWVFFWFFGGVVGGGWFGDGGVWFCFFFSFFCVVFFFFFVFFPFFFFFCSFFFCVFFFFFFFFFFVFFLFFVPPISFFLSIRWGEGRLGCARLFLPSRRALRKRTKLGFLIPLRSPFFCRPSPPPRIDFVRFDVFFLFLSFLLSDRGEVFAQ